MSSVTQSLIFLVVCIAATVSAQAIYDGKCPSVTLQPNYTLDAYLGQWYAQFKIPAVFENPKGICNIADYSLNADGTVRVNNSEIVDGKRQVDIGVAKVVGNAELNVKFPNSWQEPSDEVNYQVLATDYNTYSVVHNCRQFVAENGNDQHYQFLWILTRLQDPTVRVIDDAFGVINRNAISTQDLKRNTQSNCIEV